MSAKLAPCSVCGQQPWYNYDRPIVVSIYCCKGTSTGFCDTHAIAERKWNKEQRAAASAKNAGPRGGGK